MVLIKHINTNWVLITGLLSAGVGHQLPNSAALIGRVLGGHHQIHGCNTPRAHCCILDRKKAVVFLSLPNVAAQRK